MRYTIELHVPALQGYLHTVVACVARLCRTSIGSDDPDFQRAVLEACTNAICHSYGGDNAKAQLELCFYVGDGSLSVELVDYGRPLAADPAPAGLALCPQLADEIRYERQGDHNLLTLLRRRAAH
jgi:anti-sigma regulatory factor (Ser/Thr protein kinase)